jgi:hypothetical protein
MSLPGLGAYNGAMESHSEYMRRRAAEELDAADRASSPRVRALHAEMADRYREAADGPPPPKEPVEPTRSCLPDDLRILD